MNYEEFLKSKRIVAQVSGFDIARERLSDALFDFQKDLTAWALRKGRAAIFANTGLGKTLMQSEWARQVNKKTGGKVLILAPLAVSKQTVREARKIGLDITLCREQSDCREGVNITNYEILHKFDPDKFTGIVLDESGILKNFTGKIRTQIIDSFVNTPYKLACSATPAPNDYMELGNHSEFLGIMSRTEMLSMFFVHDGGETQKWRLKGHAEGKFWEWIASWGAVVSKPSDLGYEDGAFELPVLNIHQHTVKAEKPTEGRLFAIEAKTLQERREARRSTIEERCRRAAELVNNSDGPFLVWCDLNAESDMLKKSIKGAVEVKGSDSNEHKENSMLAFAEGKIKCLVTKPKIAGHGMNWQVCSQMVFVGLSDSFEAYFQAVRRCWRYGQDRQVQVHIITSELEGAVKANIDRKEKDAFRMISEMVAFTKEITRKNVRSVVANTKDYITSEKMIIPSWLRSEKNGSC